LPRKGGSIVIYPNPVVDTVKLSAGLVFAVMALANQALGMMIMPD
jgi:hypothetical protein